MLFVDAPEHAWQQFAEFPVSEPGATQPVALFVPVG